MVAYYTKEDYAKVYTEVLENLKHFSTSILEKLPKQNLEMYNLQKIKKYDIINVVSVEHV